MHRRAFRPLLCSPLPIHRSALRIGLYRRCQSLRVATIQNSNKVNKIAILIDGDNAESSLISKYIDEVSRYGKVTVKRIYSDWTNSSMQAWKAELNNNAIRPVQKFAYTASKNSTDTALIIDAMDLLHSKWVDGFCIVSSDSDYTGLAHRIREEGMFVMGIGRSHTPKAFISSCEVFTMAELLLPHSSYIHPCALAKVYSADRTGADRTSADRTTNAAPLIRQVKCNRLVQRAKIAFSRCDRTSGGHVSLTQFKQKFMDLWVVAGEKFDLPGRGPFSRWVGEHLWSSFEVYQTQQSHMSIRRKKGDMTTRIFPVEKELPVNGGDEASVVTCETAVHSGHSESNSPARVTSVSSAPTPTISPPSTPYSFREIDMQENHRAFSVAVDMDTGYASFSRFAGALRSHDSSFDPRHYGYPTFTAYCKALYPYYELKLRGERCIRQSKMMLEEKPEDAGREVGDDDDSNSDAVDGYCNSDVSDDDDDKCKNT